MTLLTVSETKDYLLKDNKPFFYLADTVWRAFTGPTEVEWAEYLAFRQTQGFNVLQINVLPWRFFTRNEILPFALAADGTLDHFAINDTYFDKAYRLLAMATEKGFTPALVLLWANYLPDTWNSMQNPGDVMPLEAVKPYVEYVVKKFAEFDPIYLVSGDTNFPGDKTNAYYLEAMQTVKTITPQALTTLHVWADSPEIPKVFEQSAELDFYMYQSGHRVDQQDLPYLQAQQLYNDFAKRPIINGEPCYHGHKGGKSTSRRFDDFDIRKATWQSLLSGAKAGITYGAHGLWNWYRPGDEFPPVEFAGTTYLWRTALHFEGAWDMAFAGWIFETYQLFDLNPTDIIINGSDEIRTAASADKLVIYAPFGHEIKVKSDLTLYNWTLIDLAGKRFAKPTLRREGEISVIGMHDFEADVLLVGVKG